MIVIAVDPGPVSSGAVFYDIWSESVISGGIYRNEELLRLLLCSDADVLCLEMFEARGMPLGNPSIETIFWSGRFRQAWTNDTHLIKRRDVKLHLCGTTRAKDSNVNAVLWDRFSAGQGMRAAKGTKKEPGPLYGIKSHALAALAVGVYYQDCVYEPQFWTDGPPDDFQGLYSAKFLPPDYKIQPRGEPIDLETGKLINPKTGELIDP